jgi:hypothetical protein
MGFDVDQLDITTRLVFGTSTPGADPNTHIRPDAAASSPPALSLSMRDYLDEGAGRYALPSRSPIVDAFFNDVFFGDGLFRQLADGTYTLEQLRTRARCDRRWRHPVQRVSILYRRDHLRLDECRYKNCFTKNSELAHAR